MAYVHIDLEDINDHELIDELPYSFLSSESCKKGTPDDVR